MKGLSPVDPPVERSGLGGQAAPSERPLVGRAAKDARAARADGKGGQTSQRPNQAMPTSTGVPRMG